MMNFLFKVVLPEKAELNTTNFRRHLTHFDEQLQALNNNSIDRHMCFDIIRAGPDGAPPAPPGYLETLSEEFNITVLGASVREQYYLEGGGSLPDGFVPSCPDGQEAAGSQCIPCRVGGYCVGSTFIACSPGSWSNTTENISPDNCTACAESGTDCLLDTAKVLGGYYLTSPYADKAFKCAKHTVCLGGEGRLSEVVEKNITASGYNASTIRQDLAALYQVPGELLTLCGMGASCELQENSPILITIANNSDPNPTSWLESVREEVAGITDEQLRGYLNAVSVRSTAARLATKPTKGDFGTDMCALGHEGVLCGECKDGFYRARRECKSCSGEVDAAIKDRATSTAILIPFMVIFVVGSTILYLRGWEQAASQISALCCGWWHVHVQLRIDRFIRYMSPHLPVITGLVKILLSYSQCIGAIGRFDNIQWPQIFLDFMDALEQLNIELFALIPVECLNGGRLGFHYELGTLMVIPPLVLFGIFILVLLMNARRHQTWKTFWKASFRLFFSSRVYKLIIFFLLVIYPSLARKTLSVFDCLEAPVKDSTVGDTPREHVEIKEVMRDDPFITCYEGDWWSLAALAVVGVLFYCVGLPYAALVLVRRFQDTRLNAASWIDAKSRQESYERVSLLVSTYKDEYWYMEAVWLIHRFFFTGVIYLIMPGTPFQIWVGSMASVFSFTLCIVTMPYASPICGWAQLAALLQILMTYLTMFLFQVDGGLLTPVAGPDDLGYDEWGAILVLINVCSFCVVLLLVSKEIMKERLKQKFKDRKLLCYFGTDIPVLIPALVDDERYHLFLSHVWGTGQDQMRVVKQRLCEILPKGLRVFLDVDDLEYGRGEEYLKASRVVLIFVSGGYFESVNCMRELLLAVVFGKKIVTLVEPDRSRGGLTRLEIRERLREAEDRYEKWGLREEEEQWRADGAVAIPSANEIYDKLFSEPTIEWNRLHNFQRVTLRLISERILVLEDRSSKALLAQALQRTHIPADDVSSNVGKVPNVSKMSRTQRSKRHMPLGSKGGSARTLRRQATRLSNSVRRRATETEEDAEALKYHFYVSPNNPGAKDVLSEVAVSNGLEIRFVDVSRDSSSLRNEFSEVLKLGKKFGSKLLGRVMGVKYEPDRPLLVTQALPQLASCQHMLVYLTGSTWTEPNVRSKIFAEEVRRALDEGVHLVLLHETPCVATPEEDIRRAAVEFQTFFECQRGATPRDLIAKGIYHKIAMPLKSGDWRQVGLTAVAQKITGAKVKKEDNTRLMLKELQESLELGTLGGLLGSSFGRKKRSSRSSRTTDKWTSRTTDKSSADADAQRSSIISPRIPGTARSSVVGFSFPARMRQLSIFDRRNRAQSVPQKPTAVLKKPSAMQESARESVEELAEALAEAQEREANRGAAIEAQLLDALARHRSAMLTYQHNFEQDDQGQAEEIRSRLQRAREWRLARAESLAAAERQAAAAGVPGATPPPALQHMFSDPGPVWDPAVTENVEEPASSQRSLSESHPREDEPAEGEGTYLFDRHDPVAGIVYTRITAKDYHGQTLQPVTDLRSDVARSRMVAAAHRLPDRAPPARTISAPVAVRRSRMQSIAAAVRAAPSAARSAAVRATFGPEATREAQHEAPSDGMDAGSMWRV